MRFYLDTSIWIDFYEDRKGYNGEPLGDYAWRFLSLIVMQNHKIIFSDMNLLELQKYYSMEEINGCFRQFEPTLIRELHTKEDDLEAARISKERNVPMADVLHALISRHHSAVLITRDNHFRILTDISENYKPEDFLSS